MSEALFTLIVTLSALACFRLRGNATAMAAVICGVMIGLGWLTRPAGLLLLPMIPLALVGQVPFRKLVGLSLVSLGGLALVTVPWMITLDGSLRLAFSRRNWQQLDMASDPQ